MTGPAEQRRGEAGVGAVLTGVEEVETAAEVVEVAAAWWRGRKGLGVWVWDCPSPRLDCHCLAAVPDWCP